MSTDNETFAAEMWKAKIAAAVETHNSGLHDGYQLGWADGFKAGIDVARAPARIENQVRAPMKVRRPRTKQLRRQGVQKYARALTRA
jgi:flagellar biosynthesis/type III secretory pathway protein FliH